MNDVGDHNICLHSNITGGWLSNEHIKMYLDLTVGSSRFDNAWVPSSFLAFLPLTLTLIRADQTHVTTLSSKIRELNSKVADIQREQRYMREVEANFRDASERTNARAVWWSLLQIAVLIGAAVWQMRHLKVSLDF